MTVATHDLHAPPTPPLTAGAGEPSTVIVGTAGTAFHHRIVDETTRIGVSPVFVSEPDEARQALAEAPASLRCIFVDAQVDGIEAFIAWIRSEARLFSTPVVAMVPRPSDEAYRQALALGADDVVVAGDTAAIRRRLANLEEFDPTARPPLTQGRAVLAMPDGSRRRVLGRCLRQAGFDVSFAASRAEVEEGAAGSDPANLLVADSALPPDGLLDSVESIRASAERPDLPVVVLAEDGELKSLRDESAAYSRVAVTSRDAPADHLLFLGNELMRPDVQNLRASPRILHSAICAFRPAGAIQPAYGLSYNLSREGLYIRTLEPPAPGTVLWFELKPPHHDTAVHLRGRVVWSRGLRSPGGAAPPGFGLRIDEESTPPADLQSYRDGYQAQRDELRLT